jgi:hypothetical protein
MLFLGPLPGLFLGTGCAMDPAPDGLVPLTRVPTFAVVLSDWSSTAIAMLDETGEVLDPRWIDSGTTPPGLVATLSSDVVLPTRQAEDPSFTVIDRLKTDVVSRFELPTGRLIGQVRTHGEHESAGFSSNPHDVVFLSDGTAWVTRNEHNRDPMAPASERGGDLVQLDAGSMQLTGERIDLAGLGAAALEGGGVVDARPSRGVQVGGQLIVGLERISLVTDGSAPLLRGLGPGAVAAIDLSARDAWAVALDGLGNCGHVTPVLGDDTRVIVACRGAAFAPTYRDRRAYAGIAIVHADDAGVRVEHLWHAAREAVDDVPVPVESVVSLGGTEVLAIALADLERGGRHALVRLDVAEGSHAVLFETTSADPVELGAPAFDPTTRLVLLPRASTGLTLFELDPAGVLVERTTLVLAPRLGLPPRAAYWLGL